jgi:hypothetical protein
MKLINKIVLLLMALTLPSCSEVESNAQSVSAILRSGDLLLQVVCDSNKKKCVLNGTKKGNVKFSNVLDFPWGYHDPSISMSLNESSREVLVTIDHDFGDNIIIQKIDISNAVN